MKKATSQKTLLHKIWFARFVVAFITASLIVQPWVPAITYVMAQDMISYGSNQANSLWNEIQGELVFPDTASGTELNWQGEKIPVADLFQAPKQDTSFANMSSLSEREFIERSESAIDNLHANEFTSEGQAFRTLRESAYLAKPDLTDDPLWGSTDAVFDIFDGKEISCTGDDTHVPDYKVCERINVSEHACTVFHEITIKPRPTDIVFVVDHSGSMSSTIAALRSSVIKVIEILDQEEGRDLRLGGISARSASNGNIPLGSTQAFVNWINRLGTKSGTTYTAATGLWTLNNFSWRNDPDVERLLVIMGNKDGPGGGSAELINKAAEMDVNIYVFHDHPSQKALGRNMGNGFSATGMLEVLKDLVDVEDDWGPAECIHTALTETGDQCFRSNTVSRGAVTDSQCLTLGGLNVCPGDPVWNKISESPIPGIPRMAQQVDVSQVYCPNDPNNPTCWELESNPLCGYITSTCKDGTPEQMVTDLYEFGLNRHPSSEEVYYWANKIHNGKSYDDVRHEFFRSVNITDANFINQFSCKTYVETYDCGFTESSNSGACAVQDLFKEDFADCVEELVPVEVERTIESKQVFTCQDALKLTECTIERELKTIERSGDSHWARDCFIEEEVSYRAPWASSALTANASITVSGKHTSASITQQPSVFNDWTTKVRLVGSGEMVKKVREIEVSCEESGLEPDPDTGLCIEEEEYEVMECPAESRLSVHLNVRGHSVDFTQKEYPAEEGNAPCLQDSDDWTNTTWVCEEHSPLNLGGVGFVVEALASAIDPLYPDAPATCVKGHATYETMPYGEGNLCWTAHDGTTHCEEIDTPKTVSPGEDNCAPYREKEEAGECRYDGRFAVEDGNGSTGFHYVWEHRYTCITDSTTVTKTELTPEYICSGIVRCMGDECMTPNRETSDGFGKAAAMLQVVQEIGEDVTCDVHVHGDLHQCQVFAGEAQTCMMALGGYVDCCESPGGVSLGDYITAAKGAMKLDAYLQSASSEAIRSGYAVIRDPVAAPVKYVYDAFTSVADNITAKVMGKEAAGASGKAAEGAFKETIGAAKQKLIEGANYALQETLGPEVAEMVFKENAAGELVLNETFGAVLGMIGMIYTIYTVAKLLVSIIWTCTEDELSLMVDVDLKKARYIGSYCAKKSVFGCIEMRESYCVFSSPLARILNEETRPQLGRSWGSPKSPDCSGISIDDLNRIDWNRVDLGEWMDILDITGNMPGAGDLGIEALTGSGSYLGQLAADGGDVRLNSADRNRERLDGIDLGELNQKASDDLWRQH